MDQAQIWPSCLILPSNSGSIENCVHMDLPSAPTLIFIILLIIVLSWAIYLIVAYLITVFIGKINPGIKYNYWLILLVLILAGLITTFVYTLIR